MSKCLVLVFLMMSFSILSVAGEREIALSSDTFALGQIGGELDLDSPLDETIVVHRYPQTPSKVTIRYAYWWLDRVCAHWDYEYPHNSGDMPPLYGMKTCTEWAEQPGLHQDKVVLNFKHAGAVDGESIYALRFTLPNVRQSQVQIVGTTLKGPETAIQFKAHEILNDTVKFDAR